MNHYEPLSGFRQAAQDEDLRNHGGNSYHFQAPQATRVPGACHVDGDALLVKAYMDTHGYPMYGLWWCSVNNGL